MFNFASKVINTIGDLISDNDPNKQPTQQIQTIQQGQQKHLSNDERFFHKSRFQGSDDHLSRMEPSTQSIKPTSAPVYRYPSRTKQHSTGFRAERYEENTFQTSDIDYNEDGYNMERNQSEKERQSYAAEISKDYEMFTDHEVHESKEYDENKYSFDYGDYGSDNNRRKRSLNDRENLPLKNPVDFTNNVTYPDTERNYYTAEKQYTSQNRAQNNLIYESKDQLFSSKAFKSSDQQDGTTELAQFPNIPNAWENEEEHHKTRRRRKNGFDQDSKEKGFRIDSEDKISPSPPSQEEDARNSSRSESESSDDLSFGEALATGLIPSNLTPEAAARMNIELINQPKAAMIDSFYGHSPGEVYTIPEEEDEICSPTGADGVTSLRKQRLASARIDSSLNIKQLQNQRRIFLTNQPNSNTKSQKCTGGKGSDLNDEQVELSMFDESKGIRSIPAQLLQRDFHEPFNSLQKLPPDNRLGNKQSSRYNLPTSENAQQYTDTDEPNKHTPQPSQPHNIHQSENRTTSCQPADVTQGFHSDIRSRMNPVDERPQEWFHGCSSSQYLNDRIQQFPSEMLPIYHQDRPFLACPPADIRSPSYHDRQKQCDRTPNYRSENPPQVFQNNDTIQNYQCDDRTQGYQTATHQRNDRMSVNPQDNKPLTYQSDNGTQLYQLENRCQNYQFDDRSTQVNQSTDESYRVCQSSNTTVYQFDIAPQHADNRSQNYEYVQPSHSSRSEGLTLDPQLPFVPENRTHDYQTDKPHARFDNSIQYADGSRIQIHQRDIRPSQNNQSDVRPFVQPETRSQSIQIQFVDRRRLPSQPQSHNVEHVQRQLLNQNFQSSEQRSYREEEREQNFANRDQRQSSQSHSRELQNYCREYRQSDRHQDATQNIENRKISDSSNQHQHANRKRLPLRKYNSEEKYSNFQQDYEQRSANAQSHESPGRILTETEHDSHRMQQPRTMEKLKQRSSSLEHDRDEQWLTKSHLTASNRSTGKDCYADENFDYQCSRGQRGASDECKKLLPRIAQEQNRGKQNLTMKQQMQQQRRENQLNSRIVGKSNKSLWTEDISSNGAKQKRFIEKSGQSKKLANDPALKSSTLVDVRKGESFCPQHKKFNQSSSCTNVNKPTRRMLPKEPSGQSIHRKNIKRTQGQDKSTSTTTSEGSPQHRTGGILLNAARKTERGSHLKISFSEPISNLINRNKKNLSTLNNVRHSGTDKVIISGARNDKATIQTVSTLPQSKNYIYPLPAEKPSNSSDFTHSTLPESASSLYRNQQTVDNVFHDVERLSLSSSNARSLPISINRTCSLDRYSSSEINLNSSPYYQDNFSRPGSAPGLMYEPAHQNSNQAFQLSLYEMHALKKEEKFWSDIYSALPADMKHLITNRGIGSMSKKLSESNTSFSSMVSSPATVIGGNHPSERASLENRIVQRSPISKATGKPMSIGRDNFNASLGERIGNRLRMLHEMREQTGAFANRRKLGDNLSRRSASDGEYSFSSFTNFPLCWNLAMRPHSDSAIDLIDRLESQKLPSRISGSAYNSSEYLTKVVVDKSQSYLTSPCSNVPPSPAPAQPVRLRDTALRGNHTESLQANNYLPSSDNSRSGFFSCLQNIESLTRQYEEEDRTRTEFDGSRDDETYSELGISDAEYTRHHDSTKRNNYKYSGCR